MNLSHFDVPRYLSVLPLFQSRCPAELDELAQACQVRRYTRGEAVFRSGDSCDALHVVVTGQVKLHAISTAGQEKVIELVGPGCSFGESLVFGGRPSSFNATALADTLVLSLPKDALLGEVSRDPTFALRMLTDLSHRVQNLMDDVEAYSLHSGTQRVVNYLLRGRSRDSVRAAGTVSLPVSKATIASRLSITPEYFSRVLGELEAGQMIQVDKRHIHILDAQRLERHPLQ